MALWSVKIVSRAPSVPNKSVSKPQSIAILQSILTQASLHCRTISHPESNYAAHTSLPARLRSLRCSPRQIHGRARLRRKSPSHSHLLSNQLRTPKQSCVSSLPAQCAMDPACICKDSTFISRVSCCVKSACKPAEEESTFRYASQLCGYFNVTVTQPGSKSCPKNATHTSSAGPKKTKVAQRDFSA